MSGTVQFSFANSQQVAPNAVRVEEDEPVEPAEIAEAPVVATAKRVALRPSPIVKPLNVLKLAKARLREVKRELKKLEELEKERQELEFLIAAATGGAIKPT